MDIPNNIGECYHEIQHCNHSEVWLWNPRCRLFKVSTNLVKISLRCTSIERGTVYSNQSSIFLLNTIRNKAYLGMCALNSASHAPSCLKCTRVSLPLRVIKMENCHDVNFASLVAPYVVMATACGVTGDDGVDVMATLGCQWHSLAQCNRRSLKLIRYHIAPTDFFGRESDQISNP